MLRGALVTGAVGSGKTTAAELLEERGIARPDVDADWPGLFHPKLNVADALELSERPRWA